MALIKCTECGKAISDTAKSCPHCGSETEHAKTITEAKLTATKHLIRTITALVIEIIGAILFLVGNSELADLGFSFLAGDWSSYSGRHYSDVREAGLKCVIGITLMVTCIVISIISKKYAAYQIHQTESSPYKNNENVISGRCDLCDTQGTTSICRIPDLPGKYELCQDCIDQYMAQTDGSR